MDNKHLTDYIAQSMNQMASDVLKNTFKNPRETAFLTGFAASVAKSGKIRQAYESKGVHIPGYMILSISDKCNLNCNGCYARANGICGQNENEKEALSAEKWNDVFSQAQQAGVSFCLLAGGEPLMRKDVITLAAGHKDMVFPIFTNGTLINEDYLKLFHENRCLVPIISIEGCESSTDERRGKGVYSSVIKKQKLMMEKGILQGVSITVTKENLSEVTDERFVKDLRERGVRVAVYVEYVPIGCAETGIAITPQIRTVFEENLERLRVQFPDVLILSFPGDEQAMGGCLAAARGFFHINPYGDCEPCPFSAYSDTSIVTHSFLHAVSSPLFNRLKENTLVGGEHDGGCALFEHDAEVKQIVKELKEKG